jgi:hypothetical protein
MKPRDQINLGPELAPGKRMAIRRRDGQEDEVSLISKMKDGEAVPAGAEIIHIKPGDDEWHDVDVLYRSGPAQVATPRYREGYDRIFGKKEVGLA